MRNGIRNNGVRNGFDQASRSCQREVERRVMRDGYDQLQFSDIRVDDQPGRDDWILGRVRAQRGGIWDNLTYACSVNFENGNVRSVEVNRR